MPMPQARQVADRFHLLKNWREAFEALLGRRYSLFKAAHAAVKAKHHQQAPPETESAEPTCPPNNQKPSAAQQRRNERFKQVKELRRKGYAILTIARKLKMHRRTIRLFLQLDEPPQRKRARRRNTVTPFVPYLEKRWAEGCHNAVLLWRGLREQGFRGSESTVSHYLKNWRNNLTDDAKRKFVPNKNGISRVPPSPRQTGWLLTRPDLCKKDWQAEYADELIGSSGEIATAITLVEKFYTLLKNGTVEELQNWLTAAKATGIVEIVRFANGIEGDRKAVEAAVETSWSNGQVEGQVNKLKTVKRMMFGRAKFDLLRAKVICQN